MKALNLMLREKSNSVPPFYIVVSGRKSVSTHYLHLYLSIIHQGQYLVVKKKSFLKGKYEIPISSVQSLSRVRLFAAPSTAACQASLSITNSQSLPKLVSIKLDDATQPSDPVLSPSPRHFNLSQHQGLFQ